MILDYMVKRSPHAKLGFAVAVPTAAEMHNVLSFNR